MKKIIIIALCFSLFLVGCSTSNDKKSTKDSKTAITGIDNFKWGMTIKEVKKTAEDDYMYTFKSETKKELVYEVSEGLLDYETTFTFKNDKLEEMKMEADCDKDVYDDLVLESTEAYGKPESDRSSIASEVSYFYSKTTYLCLIYLYRIEGQGGISRMYSKYDGNQYKDSEEVTDSNSNNSDYDDVDVDDEDVEADAPDGAYELIHEMKDYNDTFYPSKKKLKEHFKDDYSKKAIKYALDFLKYIDFKENALESAKSYNSSLHYSKKGLYKQLTSKYGGAFTKKEANYAIKHLKANWKKNALKQAKSYNSSLHYSKKGLYKQLTSEYGAAFTANEAQYAVNHLKANYKKNALEQAKDYKKSLGYSKDKIYQQLISEYGGQFTAEEAQYAINHMK